MPYEMLTSQLGRSRRMDLVRYRFREPQACTLGVGYQPTLATEMGAFYVDHAPAVDSR